MKRLTAKKFAMMLAMVMVTLAGLTSCDRYYDDWGWDHRGGGGQWVDPDPVVAYAIDGCWRGYMKFYHPWSGHEYTTTEIEFIPNSPNASWGRGYWVDYYDKFHEDYYVFNNIEWEVVDGELDVHFIQEDTWVAFVDYQISDNYFDGYINDNGNRVKFQLDRVSGPYWGSWDDYFWTDWSCYSDDGSYSKSTSRSAVHTLDFMPRTTEE